MFERPHHQRIAYVLQSLNADLLSENHCLFAGGTVIALRHGEFRESVDMDFLVSDVARYRTLRQLLTSPEGMQTIVRVDHEPLVQGREMRADQYGIRTTLLVAEHAIKFEIVLEGRMELDTPGPTNRVCGISTLTPRDMIASKLLANSDRWSDDGVFSRDLIDLAMMNPTLPLLRQGIAKAEQAYGTSILRDLEKAIDKMQHRSGWLERCMQAMAMEMPKALLWQRIRALRKAL